MLKSFEQNLKLVCISHYVPRLQGQLLFKIYLSKYTFEFTEKLPFFTSSYLFYVNLIANFGGENYQCDVKQIIRIPNLIKGIYIQKKKHKIFYYITFLRTFFNCI